MLSNARIPIINSHK